VVRSHLNRIDGSVWIDQYRDEKRGQKKEREEKSEDDRRKRKNRGERRKENGLITKRKTDNNEVEKSWKESLRVQMRR
jgi:hypothetical protein